MCSPCIVLFLKASISTVITSLTLHCSPRTKCSKQVVQPNLITGQTKDQRNLLQKYGWLSAKVSVHFIIFGACFPLFKKDLLFYIYQVFLAMTVLLWGLGISVELFKGQKNRSNHIYNPLTKENLRQELYLFAIFKKASVQFSSVTQLCPTLCDPMPGLPVHHHLQEFTQTHIHPVSDAIQPSHPLSSPSPPDPNPSQHQSFPMSQLFA